ncbi:MAG: hypothetical protein IKK13_06000 [Clostridia bacterium]|nr:hypothetical protein [Clostridia bacterium]
MALGFRKSLFGYNQDDVTDYIQRQAVKNTQIQTELNTKIKQNEASIKALTEQLNDANQKNSELTESIEFYREKYEEVKTLSDNIGKLYLVAQTNAKAIMNAAEQAKGAAQGEIDKNIEVLDATGETLSALKAKVLDMCNNFAGDVDSLSAELMDAKKVIEASASTQQETSENFEKLYSSLQK